MKTLKTTLLLLFIVLSYGIHAKDFNLSLMDGWRFITGDDPAYAQAAFDDRSWDTVSIRECWENQGYKGYDGFAWYRHSFFLSQNEQKKLQAFDGLYIFYDYADDVDEVFVNGYKIGQKGSLPPHFVSKWDEKRAFKIPYSVLNFGKENLIAIRVYDNGGNGGIQTSRMEVRAATSMDDIKLEVVCEDADWTFVDSEKIQFKVQGITGQARNDKAFRLVCVITTDDYQPRDSFAREVTIQPNKPFEESIVFAAPAPGFYRFTIYCEQNGAKSDGLTFNMGYQPEKIISPTDAPADFDAFWKQTLDELRQVDPKFQMTLLPDFSKEAKNIYHVAMQSLGDVKIEGYYSVPKDTTKKYPVVISFLGYGGGSTPPKPGNLPDWCEFVLSTRGQGIQKPTNTYGQWILSGLESKETYYYRGAYMDLIRGIDFLSSRPEIDTSRIFAEGGSQGGAFTWAACALDNRICAAAPNIPFLSDFKDYFQIAPWPKELFVPYLQEHPQSDWETIYTLLSYFDIKNLAPKITCPIIMGVGLQDNTCPPHINFAAYNQVHSEKKYYIYADQKHAVGSSWWGVRDKFFQSFSSKADQVDLFMGVQGFSNCVIGPQLPHASINPSPETPEGHHDGYDPHQPIRGFAQLHASGTGWGRYGQILLSPQTGFNAEEAGHDSPKSNEVAKPYYYTVNLDRYGITTELTPTHNCAFYRFTYSDVSDANILLDIAHNLPQHIVPFVNGKFLGGDIVYLPTENAVKGWGEYAGGFGSELPYKVYFYIQLDIKPQAVKISHQGTEALFAQIQLPNDKKTIGAKVGISFKSTENAQHFIEQEIGKNSFEDIKIQAKNQWEKTLSGIEIQGGTLEEKRLFYTTLYHSFVMPRERTGDHPHWDSDLAHIDDHYCVWDTWRTKYPLMILINEKFVSKTIQSFIDRFARDGIVTPTYTSALEWDWKQGGDDIDNIIADAFIKNVPGFDQAKAYELIKWNAFHFRDSAYLANNGWIPEYGERMSCSYTMEYTYNDFCASQVSNCMNDTETAAGLLNRSGNWVNLFNPQKESHGFNGFVEPRKADKQWIDIDPAEKYGSWVEYFYEGNSWVYSLFTPHQFDRLIDLCGGKETMIQRLSYGFDHGLIDMENEPGFLTPFIFTHCDRPDLTAKQVNKIRTEHFSLATGYPENEDSGAMGSWYVFTSIGLFPNAGQDYYYLLPPAFPDITVTRENGKKIHIKTEKTTPEASRILSVSLNGQTLDRFTIRHDEIADGAIIIYKLF